LPWRWHGVAHTISFPLFFLISPIGYRSITFICHVAV
jgi:hypothetical protein